jgi:hypothetical protein
VQKTLLPFLRASLALTLLASLALLTRVAFVASHGVHPRLGLTAAACAVSIAGAVAALRGRTWGLLFTSGAAIAFGGVALYGIAPPWFLAVAAVGLTPAAIAARSLWRADGSASLLFAVLALGVGAVAISIAGPAIDAGVPLVLLALFPLLLAAVVVLGYLCSRRLAHRGRLGRVLADERARAARPNPEDGRRAGDSCTYGR